MLYSLSFIAFEVAPLNVHEIGRSAGADFAEKPILGRRPAFEFMGASAEEITFRGKLFPEALGGTREWEALRVMRAEGKSQHLMRGDGVDMGWFQIVGLEETGRFLDAQGVPREIEFEIRLREADKPLASDFQIPALEDL